MTGVGGQASAEYAALLAVAALLGAGLALVAGPPLLNAVRSAFVGALSGDARGRAPVIATAADIADVQSALEPAGVTPDAALFALAERHGAERAGEVADALLLEAARRVDPALGSTRTYRAWSRLEDGPYAAPSADAGDRDVETATGAPVALWITVAAQRRAVSAALAHHTSPGALALDAVGVIPFARVAGALGEAGARGAARTALEHLPSLIGAVQTGAEGIALVVPDDSGIPPAMRAGDVVVAWPVHRTSWRGGHPDPSAVVDLGHGFGSRAPPRDYAHVVFLRPGAHGLEVIAEGLGT